MAQEIGKQGEYIHDNRDPSTFNFYLIYFILSNLK